mgnify:CR=1 FL=1
MNKTTTSTQNNRNYALSQETIKTAAPIIKNVIEVLVELLGNRTSAKKLVAIILLALQLPVAQVMILSGMGQSSAYKLRSRLRAESTVEAICNLLVVKGKRGRPQKLSSQQKEDLSKHIEGNNFYTLQHIADYIYEKFKVKLALSTVSRYMQELGFKKYKCGSLPAKADCTLQRSFYEDTLLGLTERSKKGEIKLFYMDAAHFVFGLAFIHSIFSRKRRFVKTYNGRKRYNVLGAIEFHTKEILTVTNITYITATEVEELLKKIRSIYSTIPIYIILDNARYQKCELIRQAAEKLNIELVYLPSYSPNLNLIERLWKYVKNELRRQFYDDFDVFQNRIDTIIEEAQTVNKHKLESLIGEKIQLFDDLIFIDENTYEEKEHKAT